MPSRSEIRRRMRHDRRRVSPRQRRLAAQRLVRSAHRLASLRRARRIALYLPADGEIDVLPLARAAVRRGQRVYLPVVSGRTLRFRRWRPGQPLVPNRFGIPEPAAGAAHCRTSDLDVVIAPLVAFDDAGNRLGMGGGFYDHTFAFRHRHPRWRRPRLVGAAYALQRVPTLATRHWDVGLDAIITERGPHRPAVATTAGGAE